MMTKEEFFAEVEQLLGPQHPGTTQGYGRWRRGAGEGRFEEFGVIRWFSPGCIHVMSHSVETFQSPEAALDWLKMVTRFL